MNMGCSCRAETASRCCVSDEPDLGNGKRDEEIENLCLHGYIKRRYGFIADDELRIERESAGYAYTLALAA